jgi:hypothetical protein
MISEPSVLLLVSRFGEYLLELVVYTFGHVDRS